MMFQSNWGQSKWFQPKWSTSPNDLSLNDFSPNDLPVQMIFQSKWSQSKWYQSKWFPSPNDPSPINPSLNDSGPFRWWPSQLDGGDGAVALHHPPRRRRRPSCLAQHCLCSCLSVLHPEKGSEETRGDEGGLTNIIMFNAHCSSIDSVAVSLEATSISVDFFWWTK